MPAFVILFIAGLVVLIRKCVYLRRIEKKPVMETLSTEARAFILLLIVSVLTFAVLTQVGLTDNIYCIRQYYMAYSLFMVLIPIGTYRLIDTVTSGKRWISVAVTATLVGIALISGHVQKSVLFLYEEDRIIKEFSVDHPNAKPVMFVTDDGNYDSRLQDLIRYPEFYFISLDDFSTADDQTIANADELIVFIRKTGEPEVQFDSLFSRNSKLKQCDFLTDCDFYKVYYMHR